MHGPPRDWKRQAEFAESSRGRLRGKTALVCAGASGVGGAVALAFAREGADVAVAYFNDHRAAEGIRQSILRDGSRCILMSGDTANATFCRFAVRKTLGEFGRLDILVNDAGRLRLRPGKMATSAVQDSFRASLLGMFHLTATAASRLERGGVVINTAAAPADVTVPVELVTAMTDATLTFTRCLARALSRRRIRVGAVAAEAARTPRSAAELAQSYIALAAGEVPWPSGQVCHPLAGRAAS
jgi:NAD(P)-dependent dehydrogenase (short-subunit alcohol dehydrogenase family)